MRILAGCALTGLLLVGAAAARADEAVAPPPGAPLLFQVGADGVQIYACEAKGTGFAWNFKAPDASLFQGDGRQVGSHFAGPTWKLLDGSAIVAEIVAKADAPAPGAIAWLLLRVKSHEGSGQMDAVAFVRRADTKGGAAPSSGCDAGHVAEAARMRYSAVYQFFGAPK